jgi:hypothetical protein
MGVPDLCRRPALSVLFALPFLRSPVVATRAELEESLGTVLVAPSRTRTIR